MLFINHIAAAHCDNDYKTWVYVSYFNDDDWGERITFSKKVIHPGWRDGESYDNDIMLIFLDQSVSGVPTVPINRDFNSPAAGDTLTVIGRGTTSEGGSMADELREVDLLAVDHDTCTYQNYGSVKEDLMLCAGVPEGGKDSCQGGEYHENMMQMYTIQFFNTAHIRYVSDIQISFLGCFLNFC